MILPSISVCWLPALMMVILTRSSADPSPGQVTPKTTTTTTSSSSWLSVRLVQVESDSVLLEWSSSSSHPPNDGEPARKDPFITCQARYGLLTPDKTLQDGSWWRFEQTESTELDHFLPDSPSFRLSSLQPNSSYVFAMMCRDGTAGSPPVLSNPIFFTTSPMMNKATDMGMMSHRINNGNPGNPSRYYAPGKDPEEDPHHHNNIMEPVKWTSKLSLRSQKMASYSISLGIVCGLVGFLIINVTVVMAVRRYSSWHARQSRIRQLRFIYGDSADHYYDVT